MKKLKCNLKINCNVYNASYIPNVNIYNKINFICDDISIIYLFILATLHAIWKQSL